MTLNFLLTFLVSSYFVRFSSCYQGIEIRSISSHFRFKIMYFLWFLLTSYFRRCFWYVEPATMPWIFREIDGEHFGRWAGKYFVKLCQMCIVTMGEHFGVVFATFSQPQYPEFFVKSMENTSASFFSRWASQNTLNFSWNRSKTLRFGGAVLETLSWPQLPESSVTMGNTSENGLFRSWITFGVVFAVIFMRFSSAQNL